MFSDAHGSPSHEEKADGSDDEPDDVLRQLLQSDQRIADWRARQSMGMGVSFPLEMAIINHHFTTREYSSEGSVGNPRRKNPGIVFLRQLPPPSECVHMHHLEQRLGMWLCHTQKDFHGSCIPKRSRAHRDGTLEYHHKDLERIVNERVLPQVTGGGWSGRDTASCPRSLAKMKQPTVRLFRIMTIQNELAPGAILRLRAYPFASKTFYGAPRQVGRATPGSRHVLAHAAAPNSRRRTTSAPYLRSTVTMSTDNSIMTRTS
jgi:hypothetical protein